MYQYILIGAFVIITPFTFIIVKSCPKKTEKKITSSPSPKRRREAIILPNPEPLILIYIHLMKNHNYFLLCLPFIIYCVAICLALSPLNLLSENTISPV